MGLALGRPLDRGVTGPPLRPVNCFVFTGSYQSQLYTIPRWVCVVVGRVEQGDLGQGQYGNWVRFTWSYVGQEDACWLPESVVNSFDAGH
jgi:hypothetical protein